MRRHRLVSSSVFSSTVRHGRRAGAPSLVLHLASGPEDTSDNAVPSPTQVGFVVSKAVGPAVTRNKVKRRLRNIARDRLRTLPSSAALVVRALPASATLSYDVLRDDFDHALERVVNPKNSHKSTQAVVQQPTQGPEPLR